MWGRFFARRSSDLNMVFEEEIRPENFRHPLQKSIDVYFGPVPLDFMELHKLAQIYGQI